MKWLIVAAIVCTFDKWNWIWLDSSFKTRIKALCELLKQSIVLAVRTRYTVIHAVEINMKLLPKEAVDVFEPLGYEVVSDRLGVVWKAEIFQSVEEKRGAVVKCSNGHLQAHSPQLAGLHLSRQTLQCSSHKQGHNLQQSNSVHYKY